MTSKTPSLYDDLSNPYRTHDDDVDILVDSCILMTSKTPSLYDDLSNPYRTHDDDVESAWSTTSLAIIRSNVLKTAVAPSRRNRELAYPTSQLYYKTSIALVEDITLSQADTTHNEISTSKDFNSTNCLRRPPSTSPR